MTRILVVDDVQPNRYLLQVLLTANGYEVESATNGVEALDRARARPPHIAISDILMPIMDGFALCREWRLDDKLKDIPFIFYTSTYTEPKDEEFALSLGADRFIIKPVEPDLFLAMLRETIGLFESGERLVASGRLNDAGYYLGYNTALIHKLEEKLAELRETNRTLELEIVERNRAEKALSHERDLMRLLMDNAPDGIYFKDLKSRFILVNKALASRLGMKTPDEAAGKSDADFFSNAHAGSAFDDEQGIIATGRPIIGKEELETWRDGRTAWVSTTKTPFIDGEGRVIGTFGISRDITSHKRAEQETEALLRATRVVAAEPAFETAARAVFDECGRLLGTPMGFIVLIGQDGGDNEIIINEPGGPPWSDELLRSMPFPRVFPDDAKAGAAIFYNDFPSSSLTSGMPQDHPKTRNALFSPLVAEGRLVGAVGYAEKPQGFSGHEAEVLRAFGELISLCLHRHRQKEILIESRKRYSALIENLDDAVFSLDAEGRVLFMSGTIRRYGYSPEDMAEKPLMDFINMPDRQRFASFLSMDVAEAPVPFEFKLRGGTGDLFSVRMVIRAIHGVDRRTRFSGVMTDKTSERQLEEQLRTAQKMEAIGLLAGGVAHDFNNILTVILTYSYFCLEKIHEDDPAAADILEIQKAANRATSLTRQLLAFSRKQVIEPVIIDVNGLISDMENMLRRLIGEDIELILKPSGDLWPTEADPGLIEQVVMNIIVNARDALPDGGAVTIETANVELDEDYASKHPGSSAGPHLMLAISDTGIGMDRNTIAHVFEPFFTTKPKGQGTGLGLSTVYGIVKQSGGSIWVYSEIGKGTTFKIYLKRYAGQGSAKKDPVKRVTRAAASGNERLLVVEDEDAVRILTRRILESAGYSVKVVADGSDALELLQDPAERVDLLLTDVIMPNLAGKELVDRAMSIRPGLKVLFMSGYTDNAISRRGILERGIHFISKPFSSEALAEKVREILDAPGAPAEPNPPTAKDTAEPRNPAVEDEYIRMSEELRSRLAKAAMAARYEEIISIIQEIGKNDPGAANGLSRLVERYDYAAISRIASSGADGRENE